MSLPAMPGAPLARSAPKMIVLLATYNGEHWLREQLDSILAQEGVEIEVLIGDDASTDGTRRLLDEGWRDDPRVRVLTWDKASGSAGANFRRLYAQVDLSDVDYVALADQDDIWMPRKLLSAVEALNRSGADGYSGAVRAFWPNGNEKVLAQNANVRSADILFEGAGQGCTFVVTVELFRRVQALCRRAPQAVGALHYHDWLIYLLNRAWGGNWYFDPAPCMRYRQHGGNEIGARGGLGAVTRRLAMIRNGWYAKQVKAAVDIYRLADGNAPAPLAVGAVLDAAPSPLRNVRLLALCLRSGRRSLADRCVLALAALLGWL